MSYNINIKSLANKKIKLSSNMIQKLRIAGSVKNGLNAAFKLISRIYCVALNLMGSSSKWKTPLTKSTMFTCILILTISMLIRWMTCATRIQLLKAYFDWIEWCHKDTSIISSAICITILRTQLKLLRYTHLLTIELMY